MKAFRAVPVAFMLLLVCVNGASALDRTDNKLWLAQKGSYAFSPALRARLDFNERFYADASRWEEFYVDAAFDYSLSKLLVVSPVYRHVKAKMNSADELREDRFHFNIDVRPSAGKWSFSFRSRYEYRIFSDKIKHRFTERLKVSYALASLKWLSDPSVYFSDELYYDIDLNRANNNETHLGFEYSLGRNTAMEIYYGHETKRSGPAWEFNTDIVGVETALRF